MEIWLLNFKAIVVDFQWLLRFSLQVQTASILLWGGTCYFESIATCKVLVVTEVHKFFFFEFSLWCSRHHCMILKWEFGITVTVPFHNWWNTCLTCLFILEHIAGVPTTPLGACGCPICCLWFPIAGFHDFHLQILELGVFSLQQKYQKVPLGAWQLEIPWFIPTSSIH